MERLTSREPRANGMPGVCCTHFGCGDCQTVLGHCSAGCLWEDAVWEQLAAYEDTGLEPEGVETQSIALAQCKPYVDAICDEHGKLLINPIRLAELAQAEKGGRLVVLPDVKYTDADGEKALRRAMWTCGNTNNPITRYTADAIAEKLCREAKEENLPLTLEELREMDGEPVYLAIDHKWYVVNLNYWGPGGNRELCGVDMWGNGTSLSLLAECGLYRRKPEEGTI